LADFVAVELGPSTWQAYREQRPIVVEMTPDRYEALASGPEHLEFLRTARPSSLLTVPLLAVGSAVGVLGLTKCKGQFSDRDIQLATEIARRVALFIENARRHASERRAKEARDEALGAVAHDLRNPLNAIVLQLGLLRGAGPEREARMQKGVELIKRYATRMDSLIQDLLDVTQMDAGRIRLERSPTSLAKLIADVAEPHRASLGARHIRLEIGDLEGLPDVWADGHRVLQVLENLVGNAMKHTLAGRISIGARVDGASVCVWVVDTGPGVLPEDRPHVFDRFWKASAKRGGGAGLGLSIVKGIVQAHGGRVWLESEPGQGSSFFFTLPVATELEREVPRQVEGPTSAVIARARTILGENVEREDFERLRVSIRVRD
jgi:signal transduction histidine kinase